ncbi:hypothetical protein DEM28_24620, partial [Enterobacter mori]
EKSDGQIKAENVRHITLMQIRERNEKAIMQVFNDVSNFDAVIVDALNDEDMDYFVACLTHFLAHNKKKFIFRTAASFVKALCPTPGEIINLNQFSYNIHGGIIIVGSHV